MRRSGRVPRSSWTGGKLSSRVRALPSVWQIESHNCDNNSTVLVASATSRTNRLGGNADTSHAAKLGTPMPLDVLDQHEDVGLEVEEGCNEGLRERLRHRAVVDV